MRTKNVLTLILVLFLVGITYADSDWIQYPGNGHWYKRVDTWVTWNEAKTQAELLGGYLATMTSADENDWVFNNLVVGQTPRAPWLGGFQPPGTAEPSQDWEWVTGEPWSYTNWGLNQPDDHNGQDTLVFYSSGTWDDYDDAPMPFIVESVIPGAVQENYVIGISKPASLTFDPEGNLFVGNENNTQASSIYKVSVVDRTVTAYGCTLVDPDAVIYDSCGVSGTPGAVLAGGGIWGPAHITAIWPDETCHVLWTNVSNPTDMAFDSTCRLLIVDPTSKAVFQTTGSNPTVLFNTPNYSYDITIDPDDYIYLGANNGTVQKYDSNGNLIDPSYADGLTTSGHIPIAIGPGNDLWGEDLYVIDIISDQLRRYTSHQEYVVISTGFDSGYMDMEFGPDNALYISDPPNQRIIRIIREPYVFHCDTINGDNNNDGLSRDTAFKTIQKGIETACSDDTVLVWPGVYQEDVSFLGKAITVKSAGDAAHIVADGLYAVSFINGEDENSVLENFVIRDSFTGIQSVASDPTLRFVTVVNCDQGIWADQGANPSISNSILWDNATADLINTTASYSCIQDGDVGIGNISIDPNFADPANDDYHLQSERGRYQPVDPNHPVEGYWVLDEVTSPCIDGGNPFDDHSKEPTPNGWRVNIGAYGGTEYASRSECPCEWCEWPLRMDCNLDGIVNLVDFACLAEEWLETIEE